MKIISILEHDGELFRNGDTVKATFDTGRSVEGTIKAFGTYTFYPECQPASGIQIENKNGTYCVPMSDIIEIEKTKGEKK